MLHILNALRDVAADEAKRFAGRIGRMIAFGLLALVALVVGLGFLTAALHRALADAFGPLPAAFIMSALFLLIAVICFAVAVSGGKGERDSRAPLPARRDDPDAAPLGPAAVGAAYAVGFARGLLRRRRRGK